MGSRLGAGLRWTVLSWLGCVAAGTAFAQTADLSVAAYTWAPVTMPNGATGEFSVRVTNNGPDDAAGAQLAIQVAPHFEILSVPAGCVLSGALPVPPATGGTQVLSCTLSSFDAGADQLLAYQAVARIVGAQDTQASITPPAGTTDPNAANNSLVRAPTVRTGVDFRVAKAAGESTLPAASTLTYTLTPANDGPDASAAIRVVDNLPPLSDLKDVSVAGAGWSCSVTPGVSAACDYTGGALVGSYPPITVMGRIAAASGTVTNSAAASSRDALVLDGNPANDASGNVVVVVTPGTDLAATLSFPGTVAAGSTQVLTITLHNLGPAPVTGASLVATLPAGFTTGTLPAGCTVSGQVLTCVAEPVAADASRAFAVPLIASSTPGTGTVGVQALPPAGVIDPQPANDTASLVVQVVSPYADLSISKTKDPSPALEGATLTSTITIRNHGLVDLSYTPATPLRVLERLGPNERFTGVVTGGWSCLPAGPADGPVDITCSTTGTGTLADGATMTLELTTVPFGLLPVPPFPSLENEACTGTTAGSLATPVDNNASNDCSGPVGVVATTRVTDLAITKEVGATGCRAMVGLPRGAGRAGQLLLAPHGPQ